MHNKSMINDASAQAVSITHKHILSILNTKLQHQSFDQPVRILDAGCGNYELTSYLQKFIPAFIDVKTDKDNLECWVQNRIQLFRKTLP
jgi:hypothetical protein